MQLNRANLETSTAVYDEQRVLPIAAVTYTSTSKYVDPFPYVPPTGTASTSTNAFTVAPPAPLPPSALQQRIANAQNLLLSLRASTSSIPPTNALSTAMSSAFTPFNFGQAPLLASGNPLPQTQVAHNFASGAPAATSTTSTIQGPTGAQPLVFQFGGNVVAPVVRPSQGWSVPPNVATQAQQAYPQQNSVPVAPPAVPANTRPATQGQPPQPGGAAVGGPKIVHVKRVPQAHPAHPAYPPGFLAPVAPVQNPAAPPPAPAHNPTAPTYVPPSSYTHNATTASSSRNPPHLTAQPSTVVRLRIPQPQPLNPPPNVVPPPTSTTNPLPQSIRANPTAYTAYLNMVKTRLTRPSMTTNASRHVPHKVLQIDEFEYELLQDSLESMFETVAGRHAGDVRPELFEVPMAHRTFWPTEVDGGGAAASASSSSSTTTTTTTPQHKPFPPLKVSLAVYLNHVLHITNSGKELGDVLSPDFRVLLEHLDGFEGGFRAVREGAKTEADLRGVYRKLLDGGTGETEEVKESLRGECAICLDAFLE
ncbi:hypothetical protein HDV00_012036, partial [Rhizophlyctis rosea]